jgi:hypothetical protein
LIAVSCVNSHILYANYSKTSKLKRFSFMKDLATRLTKNHMENRLQIPNLPRDLENNILNSLGHQQQGTSSTAIAERSDRLESRKTCRYCPYTKKRMTAYKCVKCETPNCLECSKKLCNECVSKLK